MQTVLSQYLDKLGKRKEPLCDLEMGLLMLKNVALFLVSQNYIQ